MPYPPTLLFDLDGTLVDTAPDLVASLNAALVNEGLQPMPAAQVRALVGAGARALIERALDVQKQPQSSDLIERMLRFFLDYYAAHIADESVVFPGVVEALEAARAQGIKLAVCTNKPEHLAVLLLDQLGLVPFFAAICGGDTFPARKPAALHVVGTIERAGGDPARALLVGDSEVDVQAARAAGIPVIAVDFGYSGAPASALGADRVISDFTQLISQAGELISLESF